MKINYEKKLLLREKNYLRYKQTNDKFQHCLNVLQTIGTESRVETHIKLISSLLNKEQAKFFL